MDRYDKPFLFNFAFDPVSEEGECKRIHCIGRKGWKRTTSIPVIWVANGYFDVSTGGFHNDASPNSQISKE